MNQTTIIRKFIAISFPIPCNIYITRNGGKNMNVVIYARFSSHSQTEQSIEGQLNVCHEYARSHSFIVKSAFNGCTNLKMVYLPNVLTTINHYAFHGCTGIESITLPDSVTTIRRQAFRNCTKLSSINYPLSLTSTDSQIYSGCSSLTSITVLEGITSIPSNAFDSANIWKK